MLCYNKVAIVSQNMVTTRLIGKIFADTHIMFALHQWFLSLTIRTSLFVGAGAVAAVIVSLVVAAASGYTSFLPWVGAPCGVMLYGAGYALWVNQLSGEVQRKFNLKENLELSRRRVLVVTAGLLWSAALIAVASQTPSYLDVVFGTLQVVVVATLVHLFSPTATETLSRVPEDGDGVGDSFPPDIPPEDNDGVWGGTV